MLMLNCHMKLNKLLLQIYTFSLLVVIFTVEQKLHKNFTIQAKNTFIYDVSELSFFRTEYNGGKI